MQLLGTPLDGQLEREIITYCSSTNAATSNLNFLFSFYLNRYDYASAMDLHQRLVKQDVASLAQQQRKVMIDSVSELIPSIQKKLCKVRSDNLGSVQCKPPCFTITYMQTSTKTHFPDFAATPFSAVVFSQTSMSSDSETDQSMILKQLIRQTQLLNSNDQQSNPFSGPPKMVR